MSAFLFALAVQVTTTCIPLGGQLTCTSTAPPTYSPSPAITQVDIRGALEAARRPARPTDQNISGSPNVGDVTSFQHELANRMGILARQGRCEDAYRLAALAGESELADASRRLCPF